MTVDWVWISLLALWQRWWPDRPGLELLDDKMQAGYARDAENDAHAAVVTWLDAWSDVLRLCDATGISSICSCRITPESGSNSPTHGACSRAAFV